MENSNTTTDPCAHLVHVLLCYHQGGDDPEFVRKAIESLVKKLKDRREQLDALISAVTSCGKQVTPCVNVHRSLDGRLQVAGRKGIPHVVYCRIWRWPGVSKNELQKLPICSTPSDHPDLICLNPFHYDRIVSTGIANPESLPMGAASGSIETSSLKAKTTSSTYSISSILCNPPGETSREVLLTGGCTSAREEFGGVHTAPYDGEPAGWEGLEGKPTSHLHLMNSICSVSSGAASQHSILPGASGTMVEEAIDRRHDYCIPRSPDFWCSIQYFELDTQVGELFKAPNSNSEIGIDGGMDPSGVRSGQRMCLGAMSNVHRSAASEKARMHIGRGVVLKAMQDGSVILENRSQKSVFVRSYYLDFEHSLIYGSTVHKFHSSTEKKIFDLSWAYAEMFWNQCLAEQLASNKLAVAAQAYAVAGVAQMAPTLLDRAGTGVDDLRRVCCTIALSFVKGWGEGYNRCSIKETPAWIEIHLHRPLQLLSLLLQRSE